VLASDSAGHLIEKFPNAPWGAPRCVAGRRTLHLRPRGDADAEQAYGHVLEADAAGRCIECRLVETWRPPSQAGASRQPGRDYRTAANHFVRVKLVAPTVEICAAAEYDAGAALLRLKDWTAAAQVLDDAGGASPSMSCRRSDQQIAYAYQQAGQLAQSAGE